jgi:hypothetical protein
MEPTVNVTEMISQFQGQGSIYWIAAASIAAGATLLLVSGLVMARRGLGQGLAGARALWRGWKPGRLSRRTARPRVELTETGYKANTLAPAPESESRRNPSADMSDLYSRLRRAANTLEDIQQALINDDQSHGISALKASRRDVDYVFKSGIG